MMAASRGRRIVWQWNCRGFKKKKATMVQYMKTLSKNKLPDVIALQEPYDRAQLPGYVPCGPSYECTGRDISVCTMVKRGTAFIEHELEVDEESDIDHIFIEILPSRGKRVTGLFVLNVYSTPSKRGLRHTFDALFREAMAKAASAPLLICGDFNAPHTQWGYGADSPKGKKLARLVDDFGLTVLNEPASHTRIGQGACRDTSPDLSMWSGAGAVAWSNSFEDLGSDHRVLCVTVGEDDSEIDVCLKARIVDWEQFRKNREQDKEEGPIEDIGEWCRGLLADVERVTKEIEWKDWRQEPPKEDGSSAGGGDGVPEPTRVDSRLAHLIEAKKSIQRRASKQKLNRKLRKKIREINQNIEAHCARLCEQEWQELCDTMDGNMSAGRTWKILRHLLDPSSTRTATRTEMAKLQHRYKDDPDAFAEEIVQTHLARPEGRTHPKYSGAPNEELDADFSLQEIRAVLQLLKTKSAPGPDRITNKILRNLNDDAIEKLCEYMNTCWKDGRIPQEWKNADVILIPKQGKPLEVRNMRPISLTSCVGKVMEHVCLNRVTTLLEKQEAFGTHIIGFRRGLSTQDAMLQIKEQVVNAPSTHVRALLGLDLKRAFDTVKHTAILDKISQLGLGARFHGYVSSFLSGREATVKINGASPRTVRMGGVGTPQGSVLSPMLFNLVMIGLPERLDAIEGINHTIYADDITVWTTENTSIGEMQDRLQRAVREVERHLEDTGLVCSPEKSEILLHRPRQKGPLPQGVVDARRLGICVTTKEGTQIPTVSKIRVLGLWMEEDGANRVLVTRLQKKVAAATHLVRRVANKRKGMKEHNVTRLIQAYALSHIAYVAAYADWSRSETDKLNMAIRKAFKTALGVPQYTATDRLLELGVHNTLEEIAEAQRIAQLERLSGTRTGRRILGRLGIRYHEARGLKEALLQEVRDAIQTENMPRNMHPVHDVQRRKRRGEAILKAHGRREGVLFVDAAKYPRPAGDSDGDGGRPPPPLPLVQPTDRDEPQQQTPSPLLLLRHQREQRQQRRQGQQTAAPPAFTMAVVDTKGKVRVAASARLPSAETAEEMAIALAVLHGGVEDDLIISDSKTAIRNYTKGWVSAEVARMLNARARDFGSGTITNKALKWFPAHVGDLGSSNHRNNNSNANSRRPAGIPPNHNERAHLVARQLTRRDAVTQGAATTVVVRDSAAGAARMESGTAAIAATATVAAVEIATDQRDADHDAKEFPATYREVLEHYRKERQKYPQPHGRLDRSQAVDFRRLQTGTFTNPYHLNRLCPALHPSPGCPWCEHERADMAHVLWECQRHEEESRRMRTAGPCDAECLSERWQAALLSGAPEEQEWAVHRARAIIEDLERCSSSGGLLAA